MTTEAPAPHPLNADIAAAAAAALVVAVLWLARRQTVGMLRSGWDEYNVDEIR